MIALVGWRTGQLAVGSHRSSLERDGVLASGMLVKYDARIHYSADVLQD
jgi:hypothetical protein